MRTVKTLPLPAPALSASTVPPCMATSWCTRARPMPSPPLRRSEVMIDLGEELEHLGAHVGGDADAVVGYPDHGDVALGLHREPDVATVGRVFCRIVQKVAHHLGKARQIGIEPKEPAGRSIIKRVPRGIDDRPRRRQPCEPRPLPGMVSLRSVILPWLTRDTSSRSSVRRTGMGQLPVHHIADLGGAPPRRDRDGGSPAHCAAAPADCAARATRLR